RHSIEFAAPSTYLRQSLFGAADLPMPTVLHRFARKAGLLHVPSEPAYSATRPLRLLLAAAIVLPVTVFVVASVLSYQRHSEGAHDQLRRNLAIVHEHAQKVFETFEFASRYLDEMTAGLSDDQIRGAEQSLSQRLRAMTMSLPQLRDLWIINAEG